MIRGQELKLVWDVREIAGLSCDGQEGKLKDVLGQIVANKQGKRDSSLAGHEEVSNMRLRDDCNFYEA